ncbi:MAG: hypothetical protein SPK06_08590, partial [Kiritimatiellia bacterium]|nr:hypothetical protein [Kiritimatiellia bacterium]
HLATHLHATLAAPINQARAANAERLAADTWPTLFDHTYTPPIPFADTLLSDPNAPSRIKNWRRLEPLKPLAEAEKNRPLPEEAARLADQQIARLFTLARQARDGQNRQLDLARQPTLDAARKEQLDLDATTQRLRSAVLQAWEQARLPLLFPSEPRPENANEQYTTLFPSVEERLQLIAREILDQIRQEAQAAAPTPPPDDPPPDQPPEETPPEEKPEEEDELFSLSIQRLGSDLQISIRQGQKTIRQMTVPARAKTFKEAMRKAVQTLSSEVLSLD